MDYKDITVTNYTWQAIINPNALSKGSTKHWKIISEMLAKENISFEEHNAETVNAGKEITEKLCRDGHRHFIILGGDGTANEVINGIFCAGIDTREVFVVPFPLGTGNDWLHTHQYPTNYLDIVSYFKKGKFRLHDVGLVHSIENKEIIASRYFINIAGFCFDAAVIQETIKGKTLILKSYTYLYQLVKVLLTYKANKVIIKAPNIKVEEKIFTIAVGICQYNGNGMKQVPMANPFDGILDVVIIKKISPLKVAMNVKNLFSGNHIHLKEVTIYQSKELELESTPYCPGEVEGEMVVPGNYKISILPQAVNILSIV